MQERLRCGLFVLLIALTELREALALTLLAWSRFLLPAAMLGAGGFLLVWSDHEAWPIGSLSFAQTFLGNDHEILQHKAYGVLLFSVGMVESLRRAGRLAHTFWTAPLPVFAIIGGLMFSLVLTLYDIPALYTFLSKKRKVELAPYLTQIDMIPAEPTARILASLWEKVLYNAPLNPLGALLRVPYGELASRPETRAIMDEVIAEGFAVALAEGAELLWASADQCRAHFYERLLPPTAHHRSSMLRDLERRRRTEIDAMNGYIARKGAQVGVRAPSHAKLAEIVTRIERGEL